MSLTYRRRSDDDTLRDGERRRVPMTAMDSVQRAIAATKQKLADDAGTEVCDALGQRGAALRRPGYRCLTGDAAVTAQQELARARQQYLDDLTNSWRGDQRNSQRQDDADADNGDADAHRATDEAGTQEGAKARRKRAQFRNECGQETGTEEVEEEDSLLRAQERRRRATDAAYADYEADLVAAHRSWK